MPYDICLKFQCQVSCEDQEDECAAAESSGKGCSFQSSVGCSLMDHHDQHQHNLSLLITHHWSLIILIHHHQHCCAISMSNVQTFSYRYSSDSVQAFFCLQEWQELSFLSWVMKQVRSISWPAAAHRGLQAQWQRTGPEQGTLFLWTRNCLVRRHFTVIS